MKKLFILQNSSNPVYKTELDYCYSNSSNDNQSVIYLNELTIEYLINNQARVVIANELPLSWYLILKGLKIVTIILGDLELNLDKADIVIDYKSDNKNKYFTGIDYCISTNEKLKEDFEEIFNLVKMLSWDSDFFGFNIAYLSCLHLTENILHNLDLFIQENNLRLVEYLCNCHDRRSVRLAEQNQFHFTDIRLTYEIKLEKILNVENESSFNFALAKNEHVSILKEISNDLYKDSRYYFDGNFDKNKINEFYRNWVEKAVLGTFDDECFLVFEKKIPLGFCTIRYLSESSAQIGLFGISKDHMGKGIALILIKTVLNKLFYKGIKQVLVVTQGRNYAAQRVYQKAGFLTKKTELWYHKWI